MEKRLCELESPCSVGWDDGYNSAVAGVFRSISDYLDCHEPSPARTAYLQCWSEGYMSAARQQSDPQQQGGFVSLAAKQQGE